MSPKRLGFRPGRCSDRRLGRARFPSLVLVEGVGAYGVRDGGRGEKGDGLNGVVDASFRRAVANERHCVNEGWLGE